MSKKVKVLPKGFPTAITLKGFPPSFYFLNVEKGLSSYINFPTLRTLIGVYSQRHFMVECSSMVFHIHYIYRISSLSQILVFSSSWGFTFKILIDVRPCS